MKEIEENTNQWKDITCHELKALILSKCSYHSKQYTHSMQPLPKFQWHFSQE